jgi:hypothetical protein
LGLLMPLSMVLRDYRAAGTTRPRPAWFDTAANCPGCAPSW